MEQKNDSFETIWNKLKECKNVVMSLHASPDGDSLGSCAAMKHVLERDFGANVTLVSGDPLPRAFKRMPFSKTVDLSVDIGDLDLTEYDTIIALDTGNVERIGTLKKEYSLPEDATVINIDHHHSNGYYGTLNFVDGLRPSTCSILLDFFRENNVQFDKQLSLPLLFGICTDTGFFNHGRDMERTFTDVSFLIGHGVDYLKDIVGPFLHNRSLIMKQFFARVVENIKLVDNETFAYSTISKNDLHDLGINSSEARLAVGQLQDLETVKFVFTLIEHDDYIKGSFRSARGIDVSKFAKALGGGGHKAAAAFILHDMTMKEAEQHVLTTIEEVGMHPIISD